MVTYTEALHNAAFVLSLGNGQRSLDNATLAVGQNLAAGTVISGPTTAAVAVTAVGTAGDLDVAIIGILLNTTDATDAATKVAYVSCDAEVNKKLLTYPTESTAGGEEAAVDAALLALGIKVRD